MEILEPSGRGADFFGLIHPVIQNLIQSSPGAKRCSNYKWVKFEISKTDTNESVGTEMLQDPTIGYDAFRVALIKGKSMSHYDYILIPVAVDSMDTDLCSWCLPNNYIFIRLMANLYFLFLGGIKHQMPFESSGSLRSLLMTKTAGKT